MAASEAEIAAKLIERLLADPAFRDRFRRDPPRACREAGLESLAEEMRLGAGKAMHTLDIRESRSSLAGVMMAAAMEGMGLYEFSKHVVPHLEDVPAAVGDVLSRIDLPALPDVRGALAGANGDARSAVAVEEEAAEEAPAAAAPAAPAPPADPGSSAAATPDEAPKETEKPPAAPEAAAAEPTAKPAADEKPAADAGSGSKASTGGAEEPAPEAPELAGLADDGDTEAERTDGAVLPGAGFEPQASEGGPKPSEGPEPAAAAPAPAGAAAPEPAAERAPIDPSDFGQEGSGGEPTPEALALLKNENIVLDDVGVADIKAGRIDPRIIGVLTKLSQEHEIVVSCMCSDHSKFTAGGSISNHAYGRGLDIASIDGEIVSPGSALAREVSSELSELDPAIRPDEIGSPFAINGPGYFTDAAHHNHIHVGFKTEITPDWKVPAELAAGAPQPAAAAGAAPAAPELAAVAPTVQPPDPKRASGLFAAAQPGKVAAAATPAPKAGGDSQLFLQSVKPEPAAAPAAEPAAAVDLSGVPGEYPGDDAPKEQIAAWMAAEAEKRGLPPELPVMAALVESNLTNVNYGDADSLGYFQMRTSIWESQYPGFADDPKKQIDWFLDTAERVKEQRVSRGLPIDDPSQYGEWIADVERPAEQYRYRYQERLEQAKELLADAPKAAAPAAPEEAPAPAPAPAPEPAAKREPIDPSDFGQDGSGGEPTPEALALLKNDNIVLDDVGVADIKAGRIDPRVIGVLTKLSQEHEIVVSCMCSDHSKFTAGGSISNHAYGRGLDIASIDGEIVSPSSPLAREISYELSEFDAAIRPDEIGTPFAINGPGYFTDAAHSNHIHVGFKTEITPDWKPPAALAASAPQPAAAVAAAAPAAPELAALAPTVQPPDPKRASGLFAAAQPGKVAAAATPEPKAGGASQLFLQSVKPEPAPAAPAAAAPAAEPAAVDLSGAPGEYPGDDAPKERIAAWMAAEAEKRGIPPQLPVMAALVESNLTNVDYGDADSLGYFQMRTSIWESQYPGFADDPKKQIDWFLDTAERVKEQRVSRGLAIDDPSQFGEWIADVERPAEQYRYRYQERLAEAERLLKDAPKAAPAAEPPAAEQAAPGEPPPSVAQGAGPKALAALKEAQKYTGTPYQWGGSTPQTGFDCSGLVQWAYAQAGVQIPRVTHDQIEASNGSPVRRSELLPGDLVFFRDPSGYVYHVGISMGGDKFLHAPRTGDVVKVASLDEPYYNERFTGGRRFDEATAAAAAPAAPAAPEVPAAAPDPVEVAAAQAAVARDAAEARQPNSGLFKAISAQEARNHRDAGDRALAAAGDVGGDGDEPGERDSGLFLKAITAEQAAQAKAEAEAAKAAAAAPATPAAPAPPAAPEVAAATPEPVPAGPPPDLSAVPADYPGDDASQKELAKWLAKRAEKAGLPPELPVMAALVESNVKNLNYGHADSVGFFQMRTSIWNQGEYAGYPENPGLQAKWFIDTALAVKRQEIAAGNAGFGKDPATWGEWIADVERPAEQYRGRYQLRLAEARRLLS